MFCYQCEQAANGKGCTVSGVCGKDPVTAALQDLLVHSAKGISMYARRAGELGSSDRDVDVFVVEALFTTVTNVNFDPDRLEKLIARSYEVKERARALYTAGCNAAGRQPEVLGGPATFTPASTIGDLVTQRDRLNDAKKARLAEVGEDVVSLEDLILFGLKGMAAYTDHAHILGQDDDSVYAFFHEALDFLASGEAIGRSHSIDELFGMAMK